MRLIQGGKPEIVWTKGDYDGVDIYVDRGNNQFVFLATNTILTIQIMHPCQQPVQPFGDTPFTDMAMKCLDNTAIL